MLNDNLDVLDEKRDRALVRMANYQQVVAKYYNSKVRPQTFNEGDLVLRKVLQNTAEPNAGKLGTGNALTGSRRSSVRVFTVLKRSMELKCFAVGILIIYANITCNFTNFL